MASGIYNFEIEQNSDFDRLLTWKDENGDPIDLTSATAVLVARVRPTDVSPVINLSNGSGLTLGGVAGTIQISIDDSVTDTYTFNSAKYKLKVNDNTILRGTVTLIKDQSA